MSHKILLQLNGHLKYETGVIIIRHFKLCFLKSLLYCSILPMYLDVLQIEGVAVTATSKTPNPAEDTCDMKRRQARPLTGKHVRPGTGASPATLLSLRRKIQARQQQHDTQKLHK